MDQIRPWPFNLRTNQTFRPTAIDIEGDIQRTVCVVKTCFVLRDRSFCQYTNLICYGCEHFLNVKCHARELGRQEQAFQLKEIVFYNIVIYNIRSSFCYMLKYV